MTVRVRPVPLSRAGVAGSADEHLSLKQGAEGSTPSRRTKFITECSLENQALALGARRRELESHHSDQSCERSSEGSERGHAKPEAASSNLAVRFFPFRFASVAQRNKSGALRTHRLRVQILPGALTDKRARLSREPRNARAWCRR